MTNDLCPMCGQNTATYVVSEWQSLALGVFLTFTSCALAAQELPKDIKRSDRHRARAEQQSHVKPVLHVRSILAANVDSIESALARELGTSAAIKYTNLRAGSQWTATTEAAEVEVTLFRGTVIDVLVRFRSPARNRTMALTLVDLQPATQPPSINAPGGPRWDKAFPNVDEVQGVYQPLRGPGVIQLSVTPNKPLYDQFVDAQ